MSSARNRNQRKPRSPRRLAHRRPRAVDREMIELQRLAMLGQLFAESAHEINSLLELACSYLRLDGQRDTSAGEADGRLQTMFDLTMIARGAALTALEFSRPGPAPVSQPTCAIETVVRLFERRLAGLANFAVSEEALPAVTMPAGDLQLVLASLIRNALDAVENVSCGQIRLAASRFPGWLGLEVWNSGPHIPKRVMDRLFDRGVSTKAPGIGLGMSMSNHLVNAAGGRLEARNEPLGGVTFVLRLPTTPEPILAPFDSPAPPVSERSSPAHSGAAGKSLLTGRQVLVVDGSEPVRLAVTTLLGAMSGATVRTCATGEQALELVGSGQPFDAVVLDLHLPRLSSQETFHRLPASVRERVIYLTLDGAGGGTIDFLAACPRPTLRKPVRYDALIEAVHSVSTIRL